MIMKCQLGLIIFFALISFINGMVRKSYNQSIYMLDMWLFVPRYNWYQTWLICEDPQLGKGVLSRMAAYAGSETHWILDNDYAAIINYDCLYNEPVNNSTKYRKGDKADDPIIQTKTLQYSTPKTSFKHLKFYFSYRTEKMECPTDYALNSIVFMKSEKDGGWFGESKGETWFDYTCIAVKSTSEHTSMQYTPYSQTYKDIQDDVNYSGLKDLVLQGNSNQCLKALKYDLYKSNTDTYRIEQKFRYGYEFISLRNFTSEKISYLDECEYYYNNYEKDT